jgi:hypothetical protein
VRRFALAVLVLLCASARAAPGAAPGQDSPELVGLRSVAGWLKTHGTEGYLGAEVAKALGIDSTQGADLDARQRGFRNAAVLRIAQLLPDSSVLFMVQDGSEVYFYHSTLSGGLRRALLALPGRTVLPLGRAEAEAKFRAEVLYWEDKAAAHN